MDLETYSKALAILSNSLARALVARLAPILGSRISPQSRSLLVQALFPVILEYRVAAETLASEFYASAMDLDTPRIVPTRQYTPEMLEEAIRLQLADSTPTRERVITRADVGKVVGVADKHFRDAGRRQTIAAVLDDDRAVLWARIPALDSRCCAFCIVLGARGPVYESRESAGEMTSFHNNCRCAVVPSKSRNSWQGRENTLAAARLYTIATKAEGESTIEAVRRYINDNPEMTLREVA